MLFKEKLLLSNCDSVRKLNIEELRKRVLVGLTFGDGVVISPNALIDNIGFDQILKKKNIIKYLNEEGAGKLVVRGFNLSNEFDLLDYFDNLPGDFIFSSVNGSPIKSELKNEQLKSITSRINCVQKYLNSIVINSESVSLNKTALQDEIYNRIDDELSVQHFFKTDGERILFKMKTKNSYSRSEWYRDANDYFSNFNSIDSFRFKSEIINPSYNSLFAKKGEGFLLDDIRVFNAVPESILDASVVYKSLKNEIELVQYAYKAFKLITTHGGSEILDIITDEALGYIEDKMKDKAESAFTRKNWFGMYPKLQRYIGLEIK